MNVIVYARASGGCAVVAFAPPSAPAEIFGEVQPENTIDYDAEVSSVVPAGARFAIVDPTAMASLPQDPSQWKFSGGAEGPADAEGRAKLTGASIVVDSAAAAGTLIAYANAKQWALATGGFTATILGSPVLFQTTETAMALIAGTAQRFAQPNPPASVDWQTGPTSFVTIAATDFVAAATEIADFIQATFDTLKVVLAAVAAGTITSAAQIDAAAWPASHG